jgi:hypothetical protein
MAGGHTSGMIYIYIDDVFDPTASLLFGVPLFGRRNCLIKKLNISLDEELGRGKNIVIASNNDPKQGWFDIYLFAATLLGCECQRLEWTLPRLCDWKPKKRGLLDSKTSISDLPFLELSTSK